MSVDQARLESSTITNNLAESLRINYDGERYALIHTNKASTITRTIILNLREAQLVEKFIKFNRKGKIK